MRVTTRHLLLARELSATGEAHAIRTEAGLSLREMAREINGSFSAVRRYETGERRPTGAVGAEYGRLLAELRRGDYLTDCDGTS